jgi:hypothetical protein
MAYKVFIISTEKDADLVFDLARRLEKAGIKVLAKKTLASEAIDNRIRRSLGESDEVFVLLTDKSLNNERVTVLLGAAFGLHKPITAVIVGVREHELPPVVRSIRHLKYADVDDYISELQGHSEKVAA